MQNDAEPAPPKSTQTISNDKCNSADTKHEDRRDVIYLSSARRRCKCYLPQPKPWASALRLRVPNDNMIAKPKRNGWYRQSGRMEATATGTTTQRGGNILCFQKWGGRQTYRMLSRQRRENSVHSILSTSKEWKRRGGLCQQV